MPDTLIVTPINQDVDSRRPHLARARLLLRKEVIQPQVPLRLPCYDLIPITSPTFGCCLPTEVRLAHILWAGPTFMI